MGTAELMVVSAACRRYRDILKSSPATSSGSIKLFRHTEWLRAAEATLNKTSSTRDICLQWSSAADEILKLGWQQSGLAQQPVALFALGKLGAQELNLSSDVDLLIIAENSPTPEMFKAFREFTRLLSESDEFGFALRLDFDLRPGGRFGPTISTLKEAENYYWTLGAPWERLALVRLRPITGNKEVIESFTEMAQKFSYRKYIDFSFLEHIKSLRAQIHNYYADPENINLKLAVGGIRDIELFCHALQVIHGGRNLAVRHFNTHEAFERLITHKLFDTAALTLLRDTYWLWRQIENEVQALEDQQTHMISHMHPMAPKFLAQSKTVDTIVEELLGKTSQEQRLPVDAKKQQEWLAQKNFSMRSQTEVWPRLFELTAKSTRSGHDELMRQEFLFQFVEQLSLVGLDKDLGLHLLDDFVRATRAKATFFSLFVSEPRLVRDLARLFSISPYLGGILSSRPELVDSFIFRTQATAPTAIDELLEHLTETRLLSEIFSATSFLETHNVDSLGQELSLTADQITHSLLKNLCAEFSSEPIDILSLGKWGGRELGLHSDLDFIFVCENEPGQNEQKVARRFISRLTEAHRGGMIYSIDLRLRPSGKAGPFLVEKNKLYDFISSSAAAWERQSYLRARSISANSDLDAALRQHVIDRGISSDELTELLVIRQKLLKPNTEQISLKYAPGGLLDIEFAAQIAILKDKKSNGATSTLEMLKALDPQGILTKSYLYLRQIEQLYRIVSDTSRDTITTDDNAFIRLASLLKTDAQTLFAHIVSTLTLSREMVKQLDPIYRSR